MRLLEVHGSTEAYAPGLADLVVDCVETGQTAREHGLEELFTLLDSRLRLVARPDLPEAERRPDLVELILAAIGERRPAAPSAT